MDIQDDREALGRHYNRLAEALQTGSWGCGRKIENMPFLRLCCETLSEMLVWNEPITWDEFRDEVCLRERS